MRGLPELGRLWSMDERDSSFDETTINQERSTKARARAAGAVPLEEREGEPQ
jgi:hypothetical protein